MKLNERSRLTWLITGLLAITTAFSAAPAVAQSSVVEGSWKLVSRTLPNGAVVMGPNLQGLLTYANGYRHISVVFQTPDGKFGSFSALANYRISATEYTETRMFRVFDDPASGEGVVYAVSGAMMTVPIEHRGSQTRIKAPFDPVIWSFEGDKMTAISVKREFEDLWERVR